jgi:23S rRNA (pseudouridine1915-N3)-methyltransferase
MKVELLLIGKTKEKFLLHYVNDYEKRIKKYIPFQIRILPSLKKTGSLSFQEQKVKEGESILKLLNNQDYLILLDENGSEYTSPSFAKKMQHLFTNLNKHIVFVVGGAYGLSEDIKQRADLVIALSQMTFPHQLVRIVFLEQLYRAMTIIKGELYHH